MQTCCWRELKKLGRSWLSLGTDLGEIAGEGAGSLDAPPPLSGEGLLPLAKFIVQKIKIIFQTHRPMRIVLPQKPKRHPPERIFQGIPRSRQADKRALNLEVEPTPPWSPGRYGAQTAHLKHDGLPRAVLVCRACASGGTLCWEVGAGVGPGGCRDCQLDAHEDAQESVIGPPLVQLAYEQVPRTCSQLVLDLQSRPTLLRPSPGEKGVKSAASQLGSAEPLIQTTAPSTLLCIVIAL